MCEMEMYSEEWSHPSVKDEETEIPGVKCVV